MTSVYTISHWFLPLTFIVQFCNLLDVWSQYREFTYIGSDNSFMTSELDLQPGLTYRSTIKLCADDICFPASRSDGVVIVPNKPVTGSLEVQFDGSMVSYIIFKTFLFFRFSCNDILYYYSKLFILILLLFSIVLIMTVQLCTTLMYLCVTYDRHVLRYQENKNCYIPYF